MPEAQLKAPGFSHLYSHIIQMSYYKVKNPLSSNTTFSNAHLKFKIEFEINLHIIIIRNDRNLNTTIKDQN